TFMSKAKRLPALNARRHRNIERFIIGKLHAFFCAVNGFEKADLKIVAVVHTAHGESAARPAPSKKIPEKIGKIPSSRVESAEAVSAIRPSIARTETGIEWIGALIAHRINLSGVVSLALFRVAQHGKSGGHALELLLGARIVFILVGMQILGELAVGAANLIV